MLEKIRDIRLLCLHFMAHCLVMHRRDTFSGQQASSPNHTNHRPEMSDAEWMQGMSDEDAQPEDDNDE